MNVEGQCFDCYDRSTFEYSGEGANQLTYVSGLTKPTTIVNCVSCSQKVEYTFMNGIWKQEAVN